MPVINNKIKIVIILLITALILGIILFVISYILNPPLKTEQVSANQILFPSLSTDNKSLLYFNNQDEAAFYKMDLQNKAIVKLSDDMDTPNDVKWSPKKDKVILKIIYQKEIFEKYGSPFIDYKTTDQTITFWIFDLNSKKLFKLNDFITDVIWEANSEEIVYINKDTESGQNEIYKANVDGSNNQKLTDLKTRIYRILSYNQKTNSLIYITNSGVEDQIETHVYKIHQNNQPTELFSNALAGSISVSPDNKKIIYSKDDNLYLFDIESNQTNIIFEKIQNSIFTWTVDGQLIVVFDYNKSVKLYKVTTTPLKKTLLNVKNLQTDITNLTISTDDKTLYLISKNLLYKLVIDK